MRIGWQPMREKRSPAAKFPEIHSEYGDADDHEFEFIQVAKRLRLFGSVQVKWVSRQFPNSACEWVW
jgi:hypothetical protein